MAMLPIVILSVVIIGAVLTLFVLAGKQYSTFIEENKADFQFVFLAPASLYLIDKTKLIERLAGRLVVIQQRVAVLYMAGKDVPQYTKMFLAQVVSSALICLLGGAVFALLGGGDKRFIVIGIILALILPAISIQKLGEKTTRRKQDIIFELPEFSSKVALLVNAGETVQKAIVRCTLMKQDNPNPLYKELGEAVIKIRNGESFGHVLEDFSKRCAVQEVSVFTTTILLNYRRGGDQLSLSLRELSQGLWEKRKTISKTRGEEASSKLVFPMVLIFVVVLVIVAFPALRIF